MRTLGFGSGVCDAVLRLLAFLLKLGNVEFEPQHNIDGTIGTRLQHRYGTARSAPPPYTVLRADSLTRLCAQSWWRRARWWVWTRTRWARRWARAPPTTRTRRWTRVSGGAGAGRGVWTRTTDCVVAESSSGSEAGCGSPGSGAWAGARRDQLLSVLYSRLFTWLINAVNDHLKVSERINV